MINTKIFAHRGASAYAPENTMEAFKLAIKQNADGIEIDVHLTKDNRVVVIHDETIDRVSNGKGFVRDYTLEELRQFSYNYNFAQYENVKIPTLEDVLKLIKPTNLILNIELKTNLLWYENIEEIVLSIVNKFEMQDRIIYSSFNHYSIQKIKELSSTANVAYLFSDVILDMVKYAKESGVNALHPCLYNLKMSNFFDKYKKNNLTLRVWTVDDEKYMKELFKENIDSIITNKPDVALKLKKEMIG